MGPFPHEAPRATISDENPAGTDGFEFVEFAHPNPQELRVLFARMGFSLAARHKTRAVELWQQGDITYVLNDEPGSHARRFVEEHGPCAPSMAWRVVDAAHAYEHAVAKGARPYDGPGKAFDLPTIVGIGGSLIYFTDRYGNGASPYVTEFDFVAPAKPAGVGFRYLDHLTHNVHKGNMDTWFRFYGDLFNFKQIRFFDIEGKYQVFFPAPCPVPAAASEFRSMKIVARLARSLSISGATTARASSTSLSAATISTARQTPLLRAVSGSCPNRRSPTMICRGTVLWDIRSRSRSSPSTVS